MDKTTSQLEFEGRDNGKEYEVKKIWNYVVYAKELEDYLLSLCYLVLWKGYLKEKNTWELALAV